MGTTGECFIYPHPPTPYFCISLISSQQGISCDVTCFRRDICYSPFFLCFSANYLLELHWQCDAFDTVLCRLTLTAPPPPSHPFLLAFSYLLYCFLFLMSEVHIQSVFVAYDSCVFILFFFCFFQIPPCVAGSPNQRRHFSERRHGPRRTRVVR